MSRRTAVVLAVALAAALAALAIARRGEPPPSDEERIRAVLDGIAAAAAARDVGAAMEAVSERFRGEGLDRQGAKRLLAFHVLRGEWVSASVAGARIAVTGDRARAGVDAILARAAGEGKSLEALLPGEATAHRFELSLEREGDAWRVVAARWRPVELADALAGPPEPEPPEPGPTGR